MVGREALGAYVGGLGLLLGPMLAVLVRSWGLCWRSWAALGAHVGGLGRSWGLCWRSWAAFGAFVGGPGPSWAEKWPKPEREGDLASGSGPKSGPNPSGKRGPKRVKSPKPAEPSFSAYPFFLNM